MLTTEQPTTFLYTVQADAQCEGHFDVTFLGVASTEPDAAPTSEEVVCRRVGGSDAAFRVAHGHARGLAHALGLTAHHTVVDLLS